MAKSTGKIVVVAGTNGAGKSVIAGEVMAAHHSAYFNPDVFASRMILEGTSREEANAIAWRLGYDELRTAVDQGMSFAFETTLGGESIAAELRRAVRLGRELHIFYIGLESVDLHIQRVRARVARGGHGIPEKKIRERYTKSLANLVDFIGKATTLRVFDNSSESPTGTPRPRLVFRMKGVRIVEPNRETLLRETPEWAQPLAAAALRTGRR